MRAPPTWTRWHETAQNRIVAEAQRADRRQHAQIVQLLPALDAIAVERDARERCKHACRHSRRRCSCSGRRRCWAARAAHDGQCQRHDAIAVEQKLRELGQHCWCHERVQALDAVALEVEERELRKQRRRAPDAVERTRREPVEADMELNERQRVSSNNEHLRRRAQREHVKRERARVCHTSSHAMAFLWQKSCRSDAKPAPSVGPNSGRSVCS